MEKKLLLQIKTAIYSLDQKLTIGRSPERNIVLSSLAVSRYHATTEIQEEGYFIYDENSSSGTFLNHKKLDPMVCYPLSEGDKLEFGNVQAQIISARPTQGSLEEQENIPTLNEKLKIDEKYLITKVIKKEKVYTLLSAKDTETGFPVIVKMLNKEMRKDLVSGGKFRRECSLVRRLADNPHPNLVKILYVEEPIIKGHYYVMEYVAGQSLQEHIEKKQKIPKTNAIDITLQIAQVLSFLYEKFKILYRDIQPKNIILTSKHIPKLINLDFIKGKDSAKYTLEGLKTSALYTDPAVVLSNKEYTVQSDIYALGLTLYCMLEGSLPFNNIISLDEQEPVKPLGYTSLDSLLLMMASRNPDERFPNYKTLIEHLEKIKLSLPSALDSTKKRTKPNLPIESGLISQAELVQLFQKQTQDISTLKEKLQDIENYLVDVREMLTEVESKNAKIENLINTN